MNHRCTNSRTFYVAGLHRFPLGVGVNERRCVEDLHASRTADAGSLNGCGARYLCGELLECLRNAIFRFGTCLDEHCAILGRPLLCLLHVHNIRESLPWSCISPCEASSDTPIFVEV